MSFTVHLVCTGNVCRSPAAELLWRAQSSAAEVTVTSSGLAALVGHDLDDACADALRRRGVAAPAHRARQFEPGSAAGADLVLTAERAQRDRIMTMEPASFRRTFTLKEFARLAGHVAPASQRSAVEMVDALARQRGAVGAVRAPDDDVIDPFRRRQEDADRAVAEIADAVATALRALGLVGAPRATRRPRYDRPTPTGSRRPRPHPPRQVPQS